MTQAYTPQGPYGVTVRESSKDGCHIEQTLVGLNIGPDVTRLRQLTVAEAWEAVRKLNSHAALVAALRSIAGFRCEDTDKAADLRDIARRALAAATGEQA